MGSDQATLRFSWPGLEMPKAGDSSTYLSPSHTAGPHGENASPHLQMEPLMFQLMLLSLTLLPGTIVKKPGCMSPIPFHALPPVWELLLCAPQATPSPSLNTLNPTVSPCRTRAPVLSLRPSLKLSHVDQYPSSITEPETRCCWTGMTQAIGGGKTGYRVEKL